MTNPPDHSFMNRLVSRLRRRGLSVQEAEDALQEAYCQLLSRPSLQDIANLDAFVWRTVSNQGALILRRKARRPETSLHPRLQAELWDAADVGADAERARVLAALDHLPPELRRVVECVYLDENSLRKAAVRLKMPFNTLKRRLGDALRQLLAHLREVESE